VNKNVIGTMVSDQSVVCYYALRQSHAKQQMAGCGVLPHTNVSVRLGWYRLAFEKYMAQVTITPPGYSLVNLRHNDSIGHAT
jgi:hypothetical protein